MLVFISSVHACLLKNVLLSLVADRPKERSD